MLNLINRLKKFNKSYSQSILIKIIFWIFLLLMGIATAYIIEMFIFNYGRFHKNRLESVDDVKISYRSISEKDDVMTVDNTDARITLKFPEETYIDRIRFETSVIEGPIYYQVEYNDDFYFRDIAYLPVFVDSTHSIVIDGTVQTVNLQLIQSKGKQFTFKLLDVSYDFSLKPVRFFVTTLVCILFFILLGCILGTLKIKLEWIGVLLILVFGGAFSLLMPAGYTEADYDALVRSYYTAQGDLIVREGEEVYFPEGFVELTEIDYRSNEDFLNYLKRVDDQKDREWVLTDREISNRNDLVFSYIPGALGVMIGEGLNLSLFGVLALTRLINMLIYAALSFFAIRFSRNKTLTLAISVFPGLLVFLASPSGAAVTAGALSLGISLFYYFTSERIYLTDCILLGVLFLIVSLYSLAMSFILLILLFIPGKCFRHKNFYWISATASVLMTILMLLVHLYFEDAAFNMAESTGLNYLREFPLSFFSQIFIYLRDSVLSFELGNTITALGKIYNNYGILSYLSLLALGLLAFKKPVKGTLTSLERTGMISLSFLILIVQTGRDFIVSFDGEEIKAYLMFIYFPILLLFIFLPSLQNNRFYIKTDTEVLDKSVLFYLFIVLASATYILLRIFYS